MPSKKSSSSLTNSWQQVRHILVIKDPIFKRTVSLENPTYSLGRHSSNSVVLSAKDISRHHATLIRRTDIKTNHYSFWILDGDLQGTRSRNGVFVNGKKCLVHELQHGDIIKFGSEVEARYHIVSSRNIEEYIESFELDEDNYLLDNSKSWYQETLVRTETKLENLSHSELIRLASFAELNPNPIVEIDLEGNITYLNSAALLKFKDLEQAKNKHPILAGLSHGRYNKNGNLFVREIQINGEIFEEYIHYIAESNLIRIYIFDLTERKQIESEFRKREGYYSAILEQLSEGVFFVDAVSRKILEANAAYCRLIGYTPEEILGLNLKDIVALNGEILDSVLQQVLTEKTDFIGESFHRKKDGSLINVEQSVSLVKNDQRNTLCFVIQDMGELNQSEKKLQSGVIHDLVSDLPNQILFDKQLSYAIANAKRNETLVGVIFLSLNRFWQMRNNIGEAIANKLVKNLAQRLKSCLREGDTIAYCGINQFAVLLPQINGIEEAARISQRILDAIEQPFRISEQEIQISSNIGIAIYPQDGEDSETMCKNADAARSQIEGKNQFQFYNPTLNSQASVFLNLENLLHRALEREEFLLYYQPQVNVNTGNIFGIEALLRWKSPELGLVSPATFINLAETTGLIVPIGEWVLKTACAQNKAWQLLGLPPMRVSVNLSLKQFHQPNLVAMVAQVLDETGLEPRLLELELTENSLRQNIQFTAKALRELQEMGVGISIDNFGLGYSSFDYLKKFPFHTLKIDQSFVRELKNNSQDLAIISAFVALGRGFNLRVVAEGVETQQQLELLRSLECEQMQGYWFSRPLAPEEATKLLPLDCGVEI